MASDTEIERAYAEGYDDGQEGLKEDAILLRYILENHVRASSPKMDGTNEYRLHFSIGRGRTAYQALRESYRASVNSTEAQPSED